MKRFAPLVTLLAVAVLGGAIVGLNTVNDPANRTAAVAAPAAAPDPAAPDPAAAAAAAPPAAADAAAGAPAAGDPPAVAPPAVAEKAYAGRSSGNEVTVAIAVKDGRAVAYVCDGKQTEAWLEGAVTGDGVSLTSADGSSTITGTVDEGASLGEITVGERSWPYSAKGVVAPAGLYEGRADVRGAANRIGWVVENDGTVTGLRKAAGAPGPLPAPAFDPADPGAVLLDGVPVEVAQLDGGDPVITR